MGEKIPQSCSALSTLGGKVHGIDKTPLRFDREPWKRVVSVRFLHYEVTVFPTPHSVFQK